MKWLVQKVEAGRSLAPEGAKQLYTEEEIEWEESVEVEVTPHRKEPLGQYFDEPSQPRAVGYVEEAEEAARGYYNWEHLPKKVAVMAEAEYHEGRIECIKDGKSGDWSVVDEDKEELG